MNTYEKERKVCPRLILQCRRRLLERRRIVRGLNSLLESFDANGIRKREIFMWLGERTITERDSSIVLDIVDLFLNIIDDIALRQTSSINRD